MSTSKYDEVTTAHILSRAWVDTYEEIAAKAQLVRTVFAARGLKIRNGSALSQLLSQADRLSRAWREQRVSGIQVLCEAAHVNRLADAVSSLPDEPGIQEALKRMAGSVMQPDDRSFSPGKDMLWEVVLLAELRQRGLRAWAGEPDIMVDFGSGDYPIACKKIWSENNVENQIKKGGKQLAPFGNGGIVALNLDDLIPAGHLVRQPDMAAATDFMSEFNLAFVERHRGVLQRAIVNGRCDGFIISTTANALLTDEETQFNLVSQTSLWHLAGGIAETFQRFRGFAEAQHMPMGM